MRRLVASERVDVRAAVVERIRDAGRDLVVVDWAPPEWCAAQPAPYGVALARLEAGRPAVVPSWLVPIAARPRSPFARVERDGTVSPVDDWRSA